MEGNIAVSLVEGDALLRRTLFLISLYESELLVLIVQKRNLKTRVPTFSSHENLEHSHKSRINMEYTKKSGEGKSICEIPQAQNRKD